MVGPRIETPRLVLRPLGPDDLDVMHRIWNERAVRRYLFDDQPVSRDAALVHLRESVATFARAGLGLFAILARDDAAIIGCCGFRYLAESPDVEILYALSTPHFGRGLATEAARGALRYAFEERGVERVIGITDVPNVASARVLERIGMRFRERRLYNGLDSLFYEIARDQVAGDPTPRT